MFSVLANIWPIMGRCTVISKREIFYLWPFGLAAWLWGTIFIDRLNVEKAQSTINKTGDTIRNNKVSSSSFSYKIIFLSTVESKNHDPWDYAYLGIWSSSSGNNSIAALAHLFLSWAALLRGKVWNVMVGQFLHKAPVPFEWLST